MTAGTVVVQGRKYAEERYARSARANEQKSGALLYKRGIS